LNPRISAATGRTIIMIMTVLPVGGIRL